MVLPDGGINIQQQQHWENKPNIRGEQRNQIQWLSSAVGERRRRRENCLTIARGITRVRQAWIYQHCGLSLSLFQWCRNRIFASPLLLLFPAAPRLLLSSTAGYCLEKSARIRCRAATVSISGGGSRWTLGAKKFIHLVVWWGHERCAPSSNEPVVVAAFLAGATTTFQQRWWRWIHFQKRTRPWIPSRSRLKTRKKKGWNSTFSAARLLPAGRYAGQ